MTSSFPTTPKSAAREALKWISQEMNDPEITAVLKHNVTALRFEREQGKDRLILVLDSEVSAGPLRRHEGRLLDCLQRGYREQGGILLSDVRLEFP